MATRGGRRPKDGRVIMRPNCPIFDKSRGGYSTSDIARMTGKAETYVIALSRGYKPIRKEFVLLATLATGRTPLDLFGRAYAHVFPEEN